MTLHFRIYWRSILIFLHFIKREFFTQKRLFQEIMRFTFFQSLRKKPLTYCLAVLGTLNFDDDEITNGPIFFFFLISYIPAFLCKFSIHLWKINKCQFELFGILFNIANIISTLNPINKNIKCNRISLHKVNLYLFTSKKDQFPVVNHLHLLTTWKHSEFN